MHTIIGGTGQRGPQNHARLGPREACRQNSMALFSTRTEKQMIFIGRVVLVVQVVRSYAMELHDALVLGDTATAEELRRLWQEKARRWIGKSHDAEQPARKRRRIKAWETLNAIDHVVGQCTQHAGLQGIRLSEEVLKTDPLQWPRLRWVSDHGSEMVCAFHFLSYEYKANVLAVWDGLHGAHNDFSCALKASRHWTYCLLMLVAWNTPYAPFDSGARFCQAQDAMAEYRLAFPHGSCELFQHFAEQLLADHDELHRRHEPGILSELWDRFCDAPIMHKRGRKVGMTRWLSLLFAGRENMPDWTTALLKWLYFGVQAGLVSHSKMIALVQKKVSILDSSAEAQEAGADTMSAQNRETISKLRAVCRNGVEAAILMHLDQENRTRMIIMPCAWTLQWRSDSRCRRESTVELRQCLVRAALSGDAWLTEPRCQGSRVSSCRFHRPSAVLGRNSSSRTLL